MTGIARQTVRLKRVSPENLKVDLSKILVNTQLLGSSELNVSKLLTYLNEWYELKNLSKDKVSLDIQQSLLNNNNDEKHFIVLFKRFAEHIENLQYIRNALEIYEKEKNSSNYSDKVSIEEYRYNLFVKRLKDSMQGLLKDKNVVEEFINKHDSVNYKQFRVKFSNYFEKQISEKEIIKSLRSSIEELKKVFKHEQQKILGIAKQIHIAKLKRYAYEKQQQKTEDIFFARLFQEQDLAELKEIYAKDSKLLVTKLCERFSAEVSFEMLTNFAEDVSTTREKLIEKYSKDIDRINELTENTWGFLQLENVLNKFSNKLNKDYRSNEHREKNHKAVERFIESVGSMLYLQRYFDQLLHKHAQQALENNIFIPHKKLEKQIKMAMPHIMRITRIWWCLKPGYKFKITNYRYKNNLIAIQKSIKSYMLRKFSDAYNNPLYRSAVEKVLRKKIDSEIKKIEKLDILQLRKYFNKKLMVHYHLCKMSNDCENAIIEELRKRNLAITDSLGDLKDRIPEITSSVQDKATQKADGIYTRIRVQNGVAKWMSQKSADIRELLLTSLKSANGIDKSKVKADEKLVRAYSGIKIFPASQKSLAVRCVGEPTLFPPEIFGCSWEHRNKVLSKWGESCQKEVLKGNNIFVTDSAKAPKGRNNYVETSHSSKQKSRLNYRLFGAVVGVICVVVPLVVLSIVGWPAAIVASAIMLVAGLCCYAFKRRMHRHDKTEQKKYLRKPPSILEKSTPASPPEASTSLAIVPTSTAGASLVVRDDVSIVFARGYLNMPPHSAAPASGISASHSIDDLYLRPISQPTDKTVSRGRSSTAPPLLAHVLPVKVS